MLFTAHIHRLALALVWVVFVGGVAVSLTTPAFVGRPSDQVRVVKCMCVVRVLPANVLKFASCFLLSATVALKAVLALHNYGAAEYP